VIFHVIIELIVVFFVARVLKNNLLDEAIFVMRGAEFWPKFGILAGVFL